MSEPMDRAVTPATCTRGAPVRVILGNGEQLTGTLKTFGAQRLSMITEPPTGVNGLRSLAVRSLQGVYQHAHEVLVPRGLPVERNQMHEPAPLRVAVINGEVELYQWVDAEGRESDGFYADYAYVKGKAEELDGEVRCLRFTYADTEPLDDFRQGTTG